MRENNKHIVKLNRPPSSPSDMLAKLKTIEGLDGAYFDDDTIDLVLTIEDEDDAAEVIQESVTLLRKEGVVVNTVKQSFPVMNMTCAACASSSQNVLSFVPGVLDAAVNFANGKAMIEYIPELSDLSEMKSALKDVGFDLLDRKSVV